MPNRFFLFITTIFLCGAIATTSYGKVFRIAAIYPMQGPLLGCMRVTQDAVKAAQKKGLEVELVRLNDHGSVIGAFLAAKKAIALNVDAVIGTENSEQALLVSDLLNTAKIPFVAPTAVHPGVSDHKPYVITILQDARKFCRMTAEYINRTAHPKKVIMVRSLSMQYSIYNSDDVARHLKRIAPHTKITFLNIIDGNDNIQRIANKIFALKPDVLFLPIYNNDIAALLVCLGKKPFPLSIYLTGGTKVLHQSNYYSLILKTIPKFHLYVITVWGGEYRSPYQKTFKAMLHSENIGANNDFGVVLSYDAIHFLIAAIQSNPKLRGLDFVLHAKQMKFDGVSGNFRFDHRGKTISDKRKIFYKLRMKKNHEGFML